MGTSSSFFGEFNPTPEVVVSFAEAYYGPYAADPVLRPNGAVMQTGDLYYNTVSHTLMVFNGSVWTQAAINNDAVLQRANNLSDVQDVPTSRTNLGLAAVAASGSASDLTSGTLPAARLPNPSATTLGGIKSKAAVANQFLTQVGTDGSVSSAQPTAADVSGLSAVATSGSATDLGAGTLPAARLPALTGDVTTPGGSAATTISNGSVTLAKQANLAANSVIGNNTGAPAVPAPITPSQVLDILGSTRGQILYRGASGWTALSPGNFGDILFDGGTGADPYWYPSPSPVPSGRLTLTSNVPVLSSNVSAAGTVYYTPYAGRVVPYWTGAQFIPSDFAEMSQALSDATKSPAAAVANKNYDMFVWSDGGPLRCTRGPAWTTDTVRAAGLTRVQGILTNIPAITNGPAAGYGVYVGTIRTNGSGLVDYIFGSSAAGGGAASFGVWNAYNRVDVSSEILDSTASWAYTTASWRNSNNSATKRHSYVIGLSEDSLSAYFSGAPTGTAGVNVMIGIASDSSTPSNQHASITNAGAFISSCANFTLKKAPLGFHYIQAAEYGGAGGTFIGTGGLSSESFVMNYRN